jgi:hypothetical protein
MPDLESTLLALGPALAAAQHPWWVLGSAAVALISGKADVIQDLDVLFDPRDAEAILGELGLVPLVVPADDQFQSAVLAKWTRAALPVELFAGFCLREDGEWREYVPQSRVAVTLGEAQAFVPNRAELLALLRRFSRPKDLARAAFLI